MSYDISKTKLEKFFLFSLGSKKFGYGHYNRLESLISIIRNKNRKFFHYSLGENIKDKNKFIKQLEYKIESGSKVILDFTNPLFLNDKTVIRLKKILNKKKQAKIYVIDSPVKKNLTFTLNLKGIKTLIPFEVGNDIKKKCIKIKEVNFGLKYFIFSKKSLKKKNKLYDIVISFGGSDNYKGTLYVLSLMQYLEIKKKVLVVIGKYFNKNYKKKIFSVCEKKKFSTISFSKNFSNILNKSRLLITNSGLTKYEGFFLGLPVLVFSDNSKCEKIDQMFVNKTKQFQFSYLKNLHKDILKLKRILNRKLDLKKVEKNILKSNIQNIKNFFKND